jgi:hypothetical protein
MRTLERSRWSVGEQKNIICRQSCSSLGDGTIRCRTFSFRQKSAAYLYWRWIGHQMIF